MIQGRGGTGLALEAFENWLSWPSSGRNFSATRRPRCESCGFIHHTHPAATEFFEDAIVGNRPAGEWRRIGHGRESYAAADGKSNCWETRSSFSLKVVLGIGRFAFEAA